MQLLGAVISYALLPVCLFLFVRRVARLGIDDMPALAAVSLGMAPFLAAWLLIGLFFVCPGRSDFFYVVTILTVYVVAGVYGLRGRQRLRLPLVPGLREATPFLVALAVLGLLLMLQATILPLTGNDPLEYALVAKMFYAAKSLAHYPFYEADPATGFYAGFSHPLGYVSLIVWTTLFDGGNFGWLSKSLSPFFTLVTLALFLTSQRKDRMLHGALAGLLLLGCSLYFQTSAICHIDALRLFAIYLSFFCLDRAFTSPDCKARYWLALCAIAAGLSLFSHSIGLLTLPFLSVAWLTLSHRPWPRKLAVVAVVCAVAMAVGGARYARNLLDYGQPLRDYEPVWNLPSIDFTSYNDRLKSIVTPLQRLTNGVLTPFIRYNGPTDNALIFFGLSFWLALVAACRPGRLRSDPMASFCLICLYLFFALCTASVLAGSSLIIKNPRYFLTVLPFAAYLGAMPAAAVAKYARERLGQRALFAANAALILVLTSTTLAMESVTLAFALPNLSTLAKGDLDYLRRAYGSEYFYPAGFDAIAWIRDNTSANARILVFRKNEIAFYSGRRILADTDPVLLPFYAVDEPGKAAEMLRSLGVTHVFIPNYQPPTFTNSQAWALCDDHRYGELVFNRKGYRVYRLREVPSTKFVQTLLPPPSTWTRPAQFIPAFLTELTAPFVPLLQTEVSCGETITGETVFATPSGIYSGPGPLDLPPSACLASAPIAGGAPYRFDAKVHGQGWLKVFLVTYFKTGGLTWDILFDGVTGKGISTLTRQVLIQPGVWQYRLLFTSGPNDALAVERPQLTLLGGAATVGTPVFKTVFATSEMVSVKNRKTGWAAPGAASGWVIPKSRAEVARMTALQEAGVRRADGTTLLSVLTGRLLSARNESSGASGTTGRMVVKVSGQGRADCFVAWDGGLAYAGAVAACGQSGEAVLPVELPADLPGCRVFFMLTAENDELVVHSTQVEIQINSS